ncbi:MAG: pyruvate ferredoxin oxidoreductase [Alphaproteobacteria bacterium]|nr:pyruvate ferredoxin oxidoreductase [Alphaproteobacteria bacterium]
MLYQLEGSQAVARAVALCRPNVVCAYPITPQTHIVEGLGELVHSKQLENCAYMNVESEMGAISAVIGSEAAGVRSYTATSSQGLLYMIEAVYNASGLDLPIVMTLGNRAIGSPINIWNDHADAMAARDAGWLMVFAESNQEAVDLHIQAFKIAEAVKCPIMVCVDGFILTHAYEQVDIPSQEEVDKFLPPYKPEVYLNEKNPVSIGAMVSPTEFMEVRYLEHKKQIKALDIIANIGEEFAKQFGRNSGGLIRQYNVDDADVVIVAMGSVLGTIKDTIDELNAEGNEKFGVLSIVTYRPFPAEAIAKVLQNKKKVIVVEKAFALGRGGILFQEIELALKGTNVKVTSVIAGIGGRNITMSLLKESFKKDDDVTFLGLNHEIIREEEQRLAECNN